ncbi:MAG: hypothetical protein U0T82_09080 [Bacteroidales bacterium]
MNPVKSAICYLLYKYVFTCTDDESAMNKPGHISTACPAQVKESVFRESGKKE